MNHCACEGEGTIPVEGNHFCAVIFFPSFLLSLFWKKINYALTNKVARPLLTLPPNRMGLVVDCAQNARLRGGSVKGASWDRFPHCLQSYPKIKNTSATVAEKRTLTGLAVRDGLGYVGYRLTDGRFASISYQGFLSNYGQLPWFIDNFFFFKKIITFNFF